MQARRIQRFGCLASIEAFNAQLRRLLAATVQKGLADNQGIALRFEPQPVTDAGWMLAEDDFEVALGIRLQHACIEKTGLDHLAIRLVAPLLGTETEVGNTAALAADPILVRAVEARIAIQIIGVVGANFRGFMGGGDEAREVRIGKFQVHFQCNAQQTREIAKSFGAGLHIGRSLGAQYLLAATPQLLAEEVPAFAAEHLLIDPVCNHVGLLCWRKARRCQ
ncbi:hypothetical protein D3C78_924170 [compost metagenome]